MAIKHARAEGQRGERFDPKIIEDSAKEVATIIEKRDYREAEKKIKEMFGIFGSADVRSFNSILLKQFSSDSELQSVAEKLIESAADARLSG